MNTTDPVLPAPTPKKTNWFLFFGLLLAPGVLALLAASAKLEGLAVAAPLIGGLVAGVACGVMLAYHLNLKTGPRIALGLVFVLVLGVFSFMLGFGGCLLGGFQLNVH